MPKAPNYNTMYTKISHKKLSVIGQENNSTLLIFLILYLCKKFFHCCTFLKIIFEIKRKRKQLYVSKLFNEDVKFDLTVSSLHSILFEKKQSNILI